MCVNKQSIGRNRIKQVERIECYLVWIDKVINVLTRFNKTRLNKIAIQRRQIQMASGQGSHWPIENPTIIHLRVTHPSEIFVKKKFWSFVKSKKNDISGVAPLKKNDIVYSNSRLKLIFLTPNFH